jgi:hypothetical protein
MANDERWKTGSFEYEGFPLFLRSPYKLNYDELQILYPQFISLTHILKDVNNNGLPNKEYNQSLFEFDTFVSEVLENKRNGVTVLIETFGGKRNYYMYSIEEIDTVKLKELILNNFPDQEILIESRLDLKWGFIRAYASDWGL